MYKKLNIPIASKLSLDELTTDLKRTKDFISDISNKTFAHEVILCTGDGKFILSDDFKRLVTTVSEIFNTVYISQTDPFVLRNKYISKLADFGMLRLHTEVAIDVINGHSELKAEIPSYLSLDDFVFKKFLSQFHSVSSALSYFFNDCNFEGVLLHGATYIIGDFSLPSGKKFFQSKEYGGLFEGFSWTNFWGNSIKGFYQKAKEKECLSVVCGYNGDWEDVSYLNKKENKKALKSRIDK